jgi:hypothetical protein
MFACSTAAPRTTLPNRMSQGIGAENWAVMTAAANTVLPELPGTGTVCVSLFHGPAGFDIPPAHLAMLDHPRVVPASACPPTYASMFQHVDSLGRPLSTRPAGYIDPYHLQLYDPERHVPNHAWVPLRLGQGTGGREYLCSVFISSDMRAFCRRSASWIH